LVKATAGQKSTQKLECNLYKGVFMQYRPKLSYFTLLLMISFASVNAVLFTPALPTIAIFFTISTSRAQQTMTWFLIGYALGQLIYGPIANRFGRKPAIFIGIILQIISSCICAYAGLTHKFYILLIGRFLLAVGSGVGFKMTFTLVNECYDPKIASQKISYLMLAFAIIPCLATALGGLLTNYYGWISCFYAGAVYGLILLVLVTRLPETQRNLNVDALKIKNIIQSYLYQFKNIRLIIGGLLMGSAITFLYVFSAIAPFIAINIFGINSKQYGIGTVLPAIGLILGSLTSAKLVRRHSFIKIIRFGIFVITIGTIVMIITMLMHLTVLFTLFIPIMIISFGKCFIVSNASIFAMSHISDTAQGSAVMNFINIGLTTIIILVSGLFPINIVLLPMIYFLMCIMLIIIYKSLASDSHAFHFYNY
jgi:MFS transporter, DHA1 family, multidrug resistance protein